VSTAKQTISTARVPRLLLKSGRTVTAGMPWAAPRGRFTLSFEAHVIALLQQCRTVRGTARLARITEEAADGVMRRAVERGLLRRQLQPPALLGFDEPERSADRPPQAARRVSGANQKAIRKGQRYATILTDVDNACVIDLVEERTKEAVLQLPGQLP
jgi:transposase